MKFLSIIIYISSILTAQFFDERDFLELDLDPTSWLKRMGYTTTKPENLAKIDLYGENVDKDIVAQKSTAELLKIKEGLIEKKVALPETKSKFGKHLFGKHMDTHEKRKIYESLETINAELVSRDEPIGGADKSNSDFVIDKFMVNKLSALGMKFEPSPYGGTGNMVIAGNKSGSDNTSIKTENVYTGGFTYTHPNATARALAASRGFAVPGGFATTPY